MLLVKWNGKNSERLDIQFKNYIIVCVNGLTLAYMPILPPQGSFMHGM